MQHDEELTMIVRDINDIDKQILETKSTFLRLENLHDFCVARSYNSSNQLENSIRDLTQQIIKLRFLNSINELNLKRNELSFREIEISRIKLQETFDELDTRGLIISQQQREYIETYCLKRKKNLELIQQIFEENKQKIQIEQTVLQEQRQEQEQKQKQKQEQEQEQADKEKKANLDQGLEQRSIDPVFQKWLESNTRDY